MKPFWRKRAAFEHLLPRILVGLYVFAVSLGTFIGGLWAAAGIGGGLALFIAAWIADGRPPRLDRAVAIYVSAFLACILVLNLHSAYPAISWHLLWQEATILLPLAVFSSPQVQARMDHHRLWPLVSSIAIIGAVALGLEFVAGAPLLNLVKGSAAKLTFYNRGISYLAVFSFPLLAFLWMSGRRWHAVAFVCILAVPIELTDSRATRAAMALGLATTVLAYLVPALTRGLLAASLLFLMVMPWSVTFVFLNDQPWFRHLAPSWQHRVEIWDYMSYRIFDRPYLGWGLGSSHLLDYAHPHGSRYLWVTEAAGHPHDSILQLWVELGLPGLLLGAAFALFALWKCARLPPAIMPFAYGAWVAALCVSLVAYNFWDDSLFSLFALTLLGFRSLATMTLADTDRGLLSQPGVVEAEVGRMPQIGRLAMDH